MKKKLLERGQAIIFLVLMFQVVFVIFAMVLNVGLLVHQKINLQNSVDFAAYYGAAKQAEYLNALAHTNYQIRQSWKLFSWRYNALFTAPLRNAVTRVTDGSPGRQGQEHIAINDRPGLPGAGRNPFSTCVVSQAYFEDLNVGQNVAPCSNIRDRSFGITLPDPVQTIAGTVLNEVVRRYSADVAREVRSDCRYFGVYNWAMLAGTYRGYKRDIRGRRQQFEALAAAFMLPAVEGNGFTDLDNENVYEGSRKTFEKNLTANQGTVEFRANNSMSHPSCNTLNAWARPIFIAPRMFYVDFDVLESGGTTAVSTCPMQERVLGPQPNELPRHLNLYVNQIDATGEMQAEALNESDQQKNHAMLGYEKNPWCQTYFEVSATTNARPVFMPIGGSYTLTAKAIAKPFGGRLGPWYSSQWPASAELSSGARVMTAEPPRLDQAVDQGGSPPSAGGGNPIAGIEPNYSRYPGDRMGVREDYHLAPYYRAIKEAIDEGKAAGVPLRFDDYYNAAVEVEESGDGLVWKFQSPQQSPVRRLELEAIQPDLFDITYYSILPNWGSYYLPRLSRMSFTVSGSRPLVARPDLGGRLNSNDGVYNNFGVLRQFEQASSRAKTNLFYVTTDQWQILTGWTTALTSNYSLDEAARRGLFAACPRPALPGGEVPSACMGGGRVGYSVKIVNADMLNSSNLPLGGAGSSGALKNPPRL